MNRALLYITAHRIIVEAIMAQPDLSVKCVQDKWNSCQLNVKRDRDLLIAVRVYADEYNLGYLQYEHDEGESEPLVMDIVKRIGQYAKKQEDTTDMPHVEPDTLILDTFSVNPPRLAS